MRERPVTLTRDSVARILAGTQSMAVIPVNPAPKRLDDAFDGTWAWPGGDYPRYDDLTMATTIRDAANLQAGDYLRVYQARGKSHLTVTTLMLELTEIRPQLLPWLEDADATSMGFEADQSGGPLFTRTPLQQLQATWSERHPDLPWEDAWVWRLQFRMVTP